MIAGDAVYTHLLTITALTDLVSTRIYHVRAPQNATLPYVTISTVDSEPVEVHSGPASIEAQQIQITAWTKHAASESGGHLAMRIADEISIGMRTLDGLVNGVTVESVFEFGSKRNVYDDELKIDSVPVTFQLLVDK